MSAKNGCSFILPIVVVHGKPVADNDQNSTLWFGALSSVAGASRTGTLVRTFPLMFDGKVSSASQRSGFCIQYKGERNWAVLLQVGLSNGEQEELVSEMQVATLLKKREPPMRPMAGEKEGKWGRRAEQRAEPVGAAQLVWPSGMPVAAQSA